MFGYGASNFNYGAITSFYQANSLVAKFAFLVMVIGGGNLVFITIKLEQLSPSLQIPLGFVYSVIPLSGLIIIFYQISNIKK